MSQVDHEKMMTFINKSLQEQEQVTVKMRSWLKEKVQEHTKNIRGKTADYVSAAVAEKLYRDGILIQNKENNGKD